MQKRTLADAVKVGSLHLKNRIVLAALTRMRADPKTGIPTDLHVKYYSQRAGAGLILSEAASVHPGGEGFPGAANLYNNDQALGWKKVVDAVHSKGSQIFVQLVHCGRNTHPKFTWGHKLWAPSAIGVRGRVPGNQFNFEAPEKEMTLAQIEELKQHFLKSYKLAKEAGFDGVEIHGANGYIIDEFIRSFSNRRTDAYGGSAENRCRLVLELVDLALTVFPKERVFIKLSPVGRYGDMFDEKPLETYGYLLQQLDKRAIGGVELMRSVGEYVPDNGDNHTPPAQQMPDVVGSLRPFFKGLLIGNQAYDKDQAEKDLAEGKIDLVSFGKTYIANPDLAERLINGWPVNPKIDFATFFGGGEKGYVDWPVYQAA